MLIDNLTLKKICIAEGFIDPHVLLEAFGPYVKKKARGLLQDISSRNAGNSSETEGETVKLIRSMWEQRRYKRKLAFILLMQAKNLEMISNRAYLMLRDEMGVSDMNKDTEEALKQDNDRGRDIFQTLQGNPATLPGVAAKETLQNKTKKQGVNS